ncbi:MAG TPA: tetratricopeptide repeat protein [Pyrinomonadaceae bacterium]|nr:tetratricopeptide repeat protein [Pyrinomonadaceae bacterium]
MRLQYKLYAAALVTLVLCCGSAFAQGHTIRGKVRNAGGVNIGRMPVTLERNGAMVSQTVTNNEGDFNFSGLTDTSYTVVVSGVDYITASESVDFVRSTSSNEPGEVRTVEITLVAKTGVRPPRPGINFVQDIPPPALAAYEAGVKLSRENHVTEAIASYQDAIKLFPNYFNAHLTLANELAKQNRFQESISHLDAARTVNPKDDRVFDLFGRVMMQQRKYAVAARIYAEAARLNPAEPQYQLAQATALIEQAALIQVAAPKAAPEERTFAFAEAERILLQLVKQQDRLADAHLQLARVYEKKGERGKAATELERYLRKMPNAKNAEQIKQAIKTLKQ